ncbi:Mitochondrial import receptor subunit TOM70-like [Oopsacas minuta]|uniref:Mitochondrial import receptor subunit TOM70-like n=1 Tax=Oopsacas minuta TaxID=111878 RepID=A0AAV7K5H5_9METZ|nr:Mitochondrial import receptor subunit TOM70-like [Oopsacas minuta]
MASKDNLPDKSNDLLYIKKVKEKKGMYCGYRRDYLAQNLSEMEEGLIICKNCTGIMREASFCRGDTTCLVCSETPRQLNPVKTVQSSIENLQIKCPLLRDCCWKGKLSEAEKHLVECKVFLIQCNNCKQIFLRGESKEHCKDLCPMRIISCRYCNKKEKAIDQEKHFDVCSKYPISCPNKCGDKFPRGVLSEHRAKCELKEISCPFSEYGCQAKSMLRRDLIAHKKEYILEHTDMSLIEIKQLNEGIQQLREENNSLKKKQTEIQWEAKTMKQLDGVEWEIKNIDKLPAESQIQEGPEFSLNNYKLRIYCTTTIVRRYGGERLKFYLQRITGEFDNILGAAIITNYKVIIVNKQDYTKSHYEEGRLNYQLKIGVNSNDIYLESTWTSCLTANKSLFIRFYFDVNNSVDLKSIKASLENYRDPFQEEAAMKWLMEKKAEANSCFTKKEYDRAAEIYTELIKDCPPLPGLRIDLSKIYHNRAASYEKMKGDEYNYRIIEDCSKAIEIDSKYAKARVRRAKAYEAVGDIMPCLKDWTLVGLIQPTLAESDPAYHRVDQLISKRGKELAQEKMKTHIVLLPSKVAVEDVMRLFSDLDIYTETNLLDWHMSENCTNSIKSPSTSSPADNGPVEGATNNIDTSTTDPPVSGTSITDNNVQDVNGEENKRKGIETEPFWQAITKIRNRQYKDIVQLTTQAISTGCRVFQCHALLMRATFNIILCNYTEVKEDVNTLLMNDDISSQMRIGAILRRACAREAVGEFDAALSDFEMALKIDPNSDSVYLVRSKFYASDELSEFDKAQSDINKSLELRPDNNLTGRCFYALLKYKIASTSQSRVEMEKVKRHLRETMKQFPNKAEPIALYAQVIFYNIFCSTLI